MTFAVGLKQGNDLSARHWRSVLGFWWRYAAAPASLKTSLLPLPGVCVLIWRFIVTTLLDVTKNFKIFNREESPKFSHPLLASADDTLFAATWFAAGLKKPVFVQNCFGKFFGGAMLCDYLSAHVVDCLLVHPVSAG